MLTKKGVSPLIATVLLIALTVVIAGLIMTWSSSFIDGGKQKSESDIALFCVSKIGFEVSNVCRNNGISFDIENLKERKIDGFIVSLLGDGVEEIDGLNAYKSESFSVSGNVDHITIVPVISVKGDEIMCSGIAVKKEVNDC